MVYNLYRQYFYVIMVIKIVFNNLSGYDFLFVQKPKAEKKHFKLSLDLSTTAKIRFLYRF